jgi:predicted RNase H-like HicB family nuclease
VGRELLIAAVLATAALCQHGESSVVRMSRIGGVGDTALRIPVTECPGISVAQCTQCAGVPAARDYAIHKFSGVDAVSRMVFSSAWLNVSQVSQLEPLMSATPYTAVIRRDGRWWIGWVEEVPGVNSQGETREELLSNLREALAEAIEMNREDARRAAGEQFEEVTLQP